MTRATSQSSSASRKEPVVEIVASDQRRTPAMRQYDRFKKQHPDCVLFFRMGDFYEMFDEDAITAHKALGITLTERTPGVPMAGVPYHAVEGYLRRMIEQGYRVAVCEQVQDPKEAKGVVDRAVTRVVTPGTLIDETLLDEARANYVAAIQFIEPGDDSAAVLAMAELSTGAFTLHELPADRVVDEMARLAPSELLYVETADGNVPPRVDKIRQALGCAVTARPAWTYRLSDAGDLLRKHFGVTTLIGFGIKDNAEVTGPAGALLRFLQETQSAADDEHALSHLRAPKLVRNESGMIVDATTLRSLEIERTLRTGQVAGSLLSVIQKCRTAMGKRLLRYWLCFPLLDIAEIQARQKAVAALLADEELASELGDLVERVQDVARIGSRISMGRATPRDVVALGRSVGVLDQVRELIAPACALWERAGQLGQLSDELTPLARRIAEQCVDAPPAHMREGGLFRNGVDAVLDEARNIQTDANTWLASYQKQLIDETGIPSLKVGYNKVFGYYIEITHVHTQKVPDAFLRKQTLKNAERYITPELKEFEDKVTTAEQRAIEREKTLFEQLCRETAQHISALHDYAKIIAELDVLLCFADVARRFDYVRPQIVEEPILNIVQGRHVVLDRMLGERFVPNDCVLGKPGRLGLGASSQQAVEVTASDSSRVGSTDSPNHSTLALITGPNMAGKSTFIRQVAIIVLLAHTGCYVPAESAVIGLTDRIFTRIGSADELHAGQSTFMVEMTETANILHHANDRSLVILDEIGRGTSTLDGLSLAWAIAETLAQKKCRTLFATHYHELTSLADDDPAITNFHVAVREWADQIIFLYRILPGRTDRSYGIHVARIAGVPDPTIKRAMTLLDSLAVQTEREVHSRHQAAPRERADGAEKTTDDSRGGPPPGAQLGLFTEYVNHPAVDELRAIDLNSLTPMQAFDALRRLHESVTDTK